MADSFSCNLAGLWYDGVRDRMLKKNQNWLCAVCGGTGSGKSYSTISMIDKISPGGFKIENCVFTPIDFMKRIRSGELKKGDIILFDEAGVGMSAREWQSIQNRLFGAVLQTFRNLNIGAVFTTPNLSFIDVQARKLFHSYLETEHLDRRNNVAILKCFDIKCNSRYDKIFYVPPMYNLGMRKYSMTKIAINKPKQQFIDEYEKIKSAYTEQLNIRVLQELTEAAGEKEELKKGPSYDELAQKCRDLKVKITGEYGPEDHYRIMGKLGCSERDAKVVKTILLGG
jgi:hypothetical protein